METEKPKRIQRKRTKGWRMPGGAVYVGRPTRWGNPYSVVQAPNWPRWGGPRPSQVEAPDGTAIYPPLTRRIIVGRAEAERSSMVLAAATAVQLFRDAIRWDAKYGFAYLDVPGHEAQSLPFPEIAGRDLACWCPPGQPCHADVLLELANA